MEIALLRAESTFTVFLWFCSVAENNGSVGAFCKVPRVKQK